MTHTLNLQLRPVEGAIIRALGLVERRGFRVVRVEAGSTETPASGAFQPMRLIVSGDRPVALLQRQLDRLHDVLRVDIESVGPGAPNWTGAAAAPTVARGS